jgi:2-polyprenyl-3-methyl-5-hydroxy-6-metoxy-1,4-benzoquinol methylase
MSCCSGKGCDEFFTDRVARRDARRYRSKGLDRNAQRLVDTVCQRGVEGSTVLEVGGGIGAIQLELLKAGAARTQNIELSSAYEPYAEELLQDAGLEGRVERRLLDFADTVEPVESADVVVLHKVVCCYPDYEALVGAAATHAKEQLLLTYPRRSWWTRLGFTAANLLERLRRKTFRAYVHPPAAIISVAQTHGLEPTTFNRGALWEFCSLQRIEERADATG